MNAQELRKMTIEAELKLRRLKNDFLEQWENPDPPPVEIPGMHMMEDGTLMPDDMMAEDTNGE